MQIFKLKIQLLLFLLYMNQLYLLCINKKINRKKVLTMLRISQLLGPSTKEVKIQTENSLLDSNKKPIINQKRLQQLSKSKFQKWGNVSRKSKQPFHSNYNPNRPSEQYLKESINRKNLIKQIPYCNSQLNESAYYNRHNFEGSYFNKATPICKQNIQQFIIHKVNQRETQNIPKAKNITKLDISRYISAQAQIINLKLKESKKQSEMFLKAKLKDKQSQFKFISFLSTEKDKKIIQQKKRAKQSKCQQSQEIFRAIKESTKLKQIYQDLFYLYESVPFRNQQQQDLLIQIEKAQNQNQKEQKLGSNQKKELQQQDCNKKKSHKNRKLGSTNGQLMNLELSQLKHEQNIRKQVKSLTRDTNHILSIEFKQLKKN